MFTDDDVRVPPNWIEGVAGPILAGEADAVCGGVRLAPHLERSWMTKRHRGWLASTEKINEKKPQTMNGANMSFSRSVLEKAPAFDPELGPGALGFADDSLFSQQIIESGLRLAGRLECEVEHHFEADRLLRRSWLDSARKRGRTLAYVAYHWSHEPLQCTWTRYLKLVTRLRVHWLSTRLPPESEGCLEWELLSVCEATLFRHYRSICHGPRHYERHGLKRIDRLP